MGRPTSKVQGRGDLTEWAGCPCKKDINCETGVNSLELRRDCHGVSSAHLGAVVFTVITGIRTLLFPHGVYSCLDISMRVDGEVVAGFNQAGILQGEYRKKGPERFCKGLINDHHW